jgi:hypothetical protein
MRNGFLAASFGALMLLTSFAVGNKTPNRKAVWQQDNFDTEVHWKDTAIDMGKIPQGKPASVYFEFTNIGKNPLSIATVKTTCGCTVPEYTTDSIPPGKTGKIKATYNAAPVGKFSRDITVIANIPEMVKLRLYGEVLPKKAFAPASKK